MSDTLILGKTAFFNDSGAVDAPAPGWAEFVPGVCWPGDAAVYESAVIIDIVGVADLHALDAHFLLLP